MATGIRKPGEFCWINMITPDAAGSRAFWASVLGWTYADIPGMGYLIKVGNRPVGGLFDITSQGTPAGTPPHIGVMVKVADADATCAKATALGGKGEKPFDIMGNLRMGMCTDPNGARFDLFQPVQQHGTDVDSDSHGAPSWFETMTTDTARAGAFYTALFGWTGEETTMPGVVYTTFKLGGVPLGGMMGITPDMGPIPPHWGVYFTVSDADAAAAEAVKQGGTQFIPPMDIPNVGRFAGLISPQAVRFYVIRYAR